ncbi:MAG: LysM peptidoglycan-binding domain-containing protein [Kiritimatiellae bacterium]|nr:LysM peptidoglycan-binding domain-containing protein [Kiritimatiellia bacterium]
MKIHVPVGIILALPLLAGCETIGQQMARQRMEEREDQLVMEENMRRLSSRVESLEAEIGRLQQELARTRSDVADTVQSQVRPLEGRVSDVEKGVRNLDQARQSDRQEIIDTLSKKMAQVLQSSRASSGSRRSSSGVGYEHFVEPGQTLSEIAAAYGVSVKVIMEENNITNPNQLRAGQKLFIPE